MAAPSGGHGLFVFMKKIITCIILLSIISCAAREEIHKPQTYIPPISPPASLAPAPEPVSSPKKMISFLSCSDQTEEKFNNSGMEVISFIRPLFYDIDLDGREEMIAGSKDGGLRLYRNSPEKGNREWRLVAGYFSGVRAGAFSAPAAGDIDHDGIPEVLIGTGGFSADSGKVIFYKNTGSLAAPVWTLMQIPGIKVGNDATPALADVDHDNRPDLIVGNSQGQLFLFRNKTTNGKVSFTKDASYFQGINLGTYVVPAIVGGKGKIIIIAGNSLGKLYLLEKDGAASWDKRTLDISMKSFATPAFISNGTAEKDMVIADGEGRLFYFKNRRGTFGEWDNLGDFVGGRILPGPACTPTIAEIDNRPVMVVGNINGEMRLFEQDPGSDSFLWKERKDFFRNIKLPGYSRGILTAWQGGQLLITGQQDGILRAFLNSGTWENPLWTEQRRFFSSGVPRMQHAAPAVFDIDGDGRWELVIGDAEGFVRGFRYTITEDGNISWNPVPKMFELVKVQRFAMPYLFRDGDRTHLIVGQQDGKVIDFTLSTVAGKITLFMEKELLTGIQVNNHSSPSVTERNGLIEMAVGDYDGNIRHYACRNEAREVVEAIR